MRTSADIDLGKRLSGFALAASVFSIAVGLAGLAGWKLHLAVLDTWGLTPVRIVPNAAACLVLLGVSLFLQRREYDPSFGNSAFAKAAKFTARSLAAVVSLVGLLSLVEHVPGWDFGIDQLLAAVHPGEEIPGVGPGLMATITALSFLLLGPALLLLDWKTRRGTGPLSTFRLGRCSPPSLGSSPWFYSPRRPALRWLCRRL